MNRSLRYTVLTLVLLTAGPVIAESGQGSHTEHRAMGMSDENMDAMHESMAALSTELDEMRDADSNDVKLRMKEKYMNQMHRQMKMMMDVMDGNRVRRHKHSKMKK